MSAADSDQDQSDTDLQDDLLKRIDRQMGDAPHARQARQLLQEAEARRAAREPDE